jgi:hypothetical protein
LSTCTAFVASHKLVSGQPGEVSDHLRILLSRNPQAECMVIDDHTGRSLTLDGTGAVLSMPMADGVEGRMKSRPGRPRLGVVAREVTLLPRHWEWLATQPGGISATLRRLVETLDQDSHPRDKAQRSLEACLHAMMTLAGDQPYCAEACEELCQGNFLNIGIHMKDWPSDIRLYLETFIAAAWHNTCHARVIDT